MWLSDKMKSREGARKKQRGVREFERKSFEIICESRNANQVDGLKSILQAIYVLSYSLKIYSAILVMKFKYV